MKMYCLNYKSCGNEIDETEFAQTHSKLCPSCQFKVAEEWDAQVLKYNSNRVRGGISAQGLFNGPE